MHFLTKQKHITTIT